MSAVEGEDDFQKAGDAPGQWPTAHMPVREQVMRLRGDTANIILLSQAGAALALAQGALILAVTPVATVGDRRRRRTALQAAVPALERAGLGHVVSLLAAALEHDADPALVLVSPGRSR